MRAVHKGKKEGSFLWRAIIDLSKGGERVGDFALNQILLPPIRVISDLRPARPGLNLLD